MQSFLIYECHYTIRIIIILAIQILFTVPATSRRIRDRTDYLVSMVNPIVNWLYTKL